MLKQTAGATARTDTAAVSPPDKGDSGHALAEFLKNELTACVTFVSHAITMRKADNQDLADQAIANAEKSYATLLPFVSDSARSKDLKAEELEEVRAQLERIRN